MQNISDYFEAKQKAKADKIAFIGLLAMMVGAAITYILF